MGARSIAICVRFELTMHFTFWDTGAISLNMVKLAPGFHIPIVVSARIGWGLSLLKCVCTETLLGAVILLNQRGTHHCHAWTQRWGEKEVRRGLTMRSASLMSLSALLTLFRLSSAQPAAKIKIEYPLKIVCFIIQKIVCACLEKGHFDWVMFLVWHIIWQFWRCKVAPWYPKGRLLIIIFDNLCAKQIIILYTGHHLSVSRILTTTRRSALRDWFRISD